MFGTFGSLKRFVIVSLFFLVAGSPVMAESLAMDEEAYEFGQQILKRYGWLDTAEEIFAGIENPSIKVLTEAALARAQAKKAKETTERLKFMMMATEKLESYLSTAEDSPLKVKVMEEKVSLSDEYMGMLRAGIKKEKDADVKKLLRAEAFKIYYAKIKEDTALQKKYMQEEEKIMDDMPDPPEEGASAKEKADYKAAVAKYQVAIGKRFNASVVLTIDYYYLATIADPSIPEHEKILKEGKSKIGEFNSEFDAVPAYGTKIPPLFGKFLAAWAENASGASKAILIDETFKTFKNVIKKEWPDYNAEEEGVFISLKPEQVAYVRSNKAIACFGMLEAANKLKRYEDGIWAWNFFRKGCKAVKVKDPETERMVPLTLANPVNIYDNYKRDSGWGEFIVQMRLEYAICLTKKGDTVVAEKEKQALMAYLMDKVDRSKGAEKENWEKIYKRVERELLGSIPQEKKTAKQLFEMVKQKRRQRDWFAALDELEYLAGKFPEFEKKIKENRRLSSKDKTEALKELKSLEYEVWYNIPLMYDASRLNQPLRAALLYKHVADTYPDYSYSTSTRSYDRNKIVEFYVAKLYGHMSFDPGALTFLKKELMEAGEKYPDVVDGTFINAQLAANEADKMRRDAAVTRDAEKKKKLLEASVERYKKASGFYKKVSLTSKNAEVASISTPRCLSNARAVSKTISGWPQEKKDAMDTLVLDGWKSYIKGTEEDGVSKIGYDTEKAWGIMAEGLKKEFPKETENIDSYISSKKIAKPADDDDVERKENIAKIKSKIDTRRDYIAQAMYALGNMYVVKADWVNSMEALTEFDDKHFANVYSTLSDKDIRRKRRAGIEKDVRYKRFFVLYSLGKNVAKESQQLIKKVRSEEGDPKALEELKKVTADVNKMVTDAVKIIDAMERGGAVDKQTMETLIKSYVGVSQMIKQVSINYSIIAEKENDLQKKNELEDSALKAKIYASVKLDEAIKRMEKIGQRIHPFLYQDVADGYYEGGRWKKALEYYEHVYAAIFKPSMKRIAGDLVKIRGAERNN